MMGPSNPNAPRPPIDPYDGWDLTNRPAMLPFLAEYTNRQTGEKSGGFAWPTMVTEPLRAANELLNTPPGTMPNPQNPEQQENALTLLMSLYGGNALDGSRRMNALADTAQRYPAVMKNDFRQQPSLRHRQAVIMAALLLVQKQNRKALSPTTARLTTSISSTCRKSAPEKAHRLTAMGCILLKMKGWRRGIGMRFHLMVLASSLEAVCASTAATSTRRLNIYAVVIGQEMNRSQSTIAKP